MLDYISRKAVLAQKGDCYDSEGHLLYAVGTGNILRIPAADVVEVVHAEWVAENSRPKSGIFYCSNCHRTCYDPQPTRVKGWTKRCRYHYCPNCGAKMDGGQDDV